MFNRHVKKSLYDAIKTYLSLVISIDLWVLVKTLAEGTMDLISMIYFSSFLLLMFSPIAILLFIINVKKKRVIRRRVKVF
ncbi:MAG: hypothetical protein DRJ32_01205 [Thermoprotei archaeon]|nr:MAG: hypothetical protein DRJ32_01205 [Thermoprotei archaeon]